MTSSDAPFFVDPVAPQNSGVDFLGLAAVGERLIGIALPGINNVTRYVRAYSMASWTAWKFDQLLGRAPRASIVGGTKGTFPEVSRESGIDI